MEDDDKRTMHPPSLSLLTKVTTTKKSVCISITLLFCRFRYYCDGGGPNVVSGGNWQGSRVSSIPKAQLEIPLEKKLRFSELYTHIQILWIRQCVCCSPFLLVLLLLWIWNQATPIIKSLEGKVNKEIVMPLLSQLIKLQGAKPFCYSRNNTSASRL